MALIQTPNFSCTKLNAQIIYYNIFFKQFDQNEHFSPFDLSLAAIRISV